MSDPYKKILKSTAWCLVGIILIICIFLTGVTLWLTPERVTGIINGQASKYLAADVRASNVSVSIWRSFPYLKIHADSLRIDSRTLDSMPKEIMRQLPENAKFLASTGELEAEINIIKAIRKKIVFRDISVDSPNVNLVVYNDSINNYNIFPEKIDLSKAPPVSLGTVTTGEPMFLSYFNAQQPADVDVSITKALIRKNDGKGEAYRVSMTGAMEGGIKGYSLAKSLPISFDGNIDFNAKSSLLGLSDAKMTAGPVRALIDMALSAGNPTTIRSLSLNVSSEDISNVLDYVAVPGLPAFEASMPVAANLSLLQPYTLSPTDNDGDTPLPALAIDLSVPQGQITFNPASKGTETLSGINLAANMLFDPRRPDESLLNITRCEASADGTNVNLTADITGLLAETPRLTADAAYDADLATLAKLALPSYMKMTGRVKGNTHIAGKILPSRMMIDSVATRSEIKANQLVVNDLQDKITARLSNVATTLTAFARNVSAKNIGQIANKLSGKAEIAAGSGSLTSAGDSLSLSFSNLAIAGKIPVAGKAKGSLDISAQHAAASLPGSDMNATGIALAMKGNLLTNPWQPSTNYSESFSSTEDSLISTRSSHSPVYLTVSAPTMLQTALSLLNMNASLKIDDGSFYSRAYPTVSTFSDVDVSTDLDTLRINSLHLAMRHTSADVAGLIPDLRTFLMASSAAPLKLDLDVSFDEVDINNLAGTYYDGVAKLSGKPADYTVPPLNGFTSADSVCIAIPRNLLADIRLSADNARYMDWAFSPLSTEITLHNGDARLGNLHIGSGFCDAKVDWTYSTADFNNIYMDLHLDVDSLNLQHLFDTFPMITENNPQVENLSGIISVNADGHFLMFPNMFVNAPSMSGELTLNGDGLTYDRSGKVAKITHLMLIRGDAPLKIDDFTVHGSLHDNLMQLDPFTLHCDPYKLYIGGVNNFEGDMYYHLGVTGWPLRLPFGVNIVGNFQHPKIRMGGPAIHDGREREISADLNDDMNVNIMQQLKHGWLLFVESAAKYDAAHREALTEL